MSPEYFTDGIKQTFGKITYYVEKSGIYFALFLYIELLIDVFIVAVKAFQVHKLAEKTVGFLKVLLTATYSVLFVSNYVNFWDNRHKGIKSTI